MRSRIRQAAWLFSVSLVVAVASFYLYSRYFDTPKVMSLKRGNAELVSQIELLSKQFQDADNFLGQLELRDNNIYRPTFGMEIIPPSVRGQGFGGAERYSALEKSTYANILTNSARDLDKLMKKTYIQSVSFDSVMAVAIHVKEMSLCVPAIQPVSISDRVRRIGAFGWRTDPFYKDIRLHEGIDFSGKVGEPVVVTGNGVVEKIERNIWGYGNMILINHGFGYKSRYAHLHDVEVSAGQHLVRGQRIGTLGNTGKSTGPHLHYEVIYRNRPTNPINFFANNMSEEEYEQMLRHFTQEALGSED